MSFGPCFSFPMVLGRLASMSCARLFHNLFAGWVAPIEHFQPCLHVSMSALFHPSHGTRTLTPLEPRPSLGLAPLPLRTLSPQWCGPTSFLLGPEEATIDASVKNAADFTSSSWSARIFEQCPVSALHTNQVQIQT